LEHDLPEVLPHDRMKGRRQLDGPIQAQGGWSELDLDFLRKAYGAETAGDSNVCRCRRCGQYCHDNLRIRTGKQESYGHRTGTPQHPGPWVVDGYRDVYYSFCVRCGLYER
jgi:hypothetical protein